MHMCYLITLGWELYNEASVAPVKPMHTHTGGECELVLSLLVEKSPDRWNSPHGSVFYYTLF